MNHRFDAYAAGLVDGEGCITAKSTKSGTGIGIRVLIGMSTKAQAVLNRMCSVYGGTLITQNPPNPKHSPITTWTVTGAEAARFLDRIGPHLILKAEQAAIALKIDMIRTSQERIGSRDHFRWTPENLHRCQVLHRRLNELNARGRESSTVEMGAPFARLVAGQWVTDQADLFSDLGWEPFTGTWPRSGYMSDGQAFELPTLVPPTTGNGSSSSPHLPTPVAQPSGNTPENHLRKKPGREVVTDLAILVENDLLKSGGKVLPTPEAKNVHAGPDYARKGRKKSGGDDLVPATTKPSTGVPTAPLFDAGNT